MRFPREPLSLANHYSHDALTNPRGTCKLRLVDSVYLMHEEATMVLPV